MISIPRKLVSTLRTVFRKASIGSAKNQGNVMLKACDGQLRVQFNNGQVGVEFTDADAISSGETLVPISAFADFKGTKDDNVIFRPLKDAVVADWHECGFRRERQYSFVSNSFPWLERPKTMSSLGQGRSLAAIAEVMECSSDSHLKFALDKIQLRGRQGEAVGSDGHQLLFVRGFQFPWTDNILIHRSDVFRCRELTDASEVEVGRTENHVVFRAGAWTIWMTIDKQGRYPNVDQIVPDASTATRLVFSEGESYQVVQAFLSLPGDRESNSPVTIHANGKIVIRASGEDEAPAVFSLNDSRVFGPEVCLAMNRHFISRALRLGVRELRLTDEKTAIVARDERHTYVWMPLAKGLAIPATKKSTNKVSPPPMADETSQSTA